MRALTLGTRSAQCIDPRGTSARLATQWAELGHHSAFKAALKLEPKTTATNTTVDCCRTEAQDQHGRDPLKRETKKGTGKEKAKQPRRKKEEKISHAGRNRGRWNKTGDATRRLNALHGSANELGVLRCPIVG